MAETMAERLDKVTVSRRALMEILERYAAGDTTVDPESDEALDALLRALEDKSQ